MKDLHHPSASALLRVILIINFWICSVAGAPEPYQMTWSTGKYGSDGPWQAVTVSMGNPGQEIALYPGGDWQTSILLSYVCDNNTISSVCYATNAGLYNPEASSTWDNQSIELAPNGWTSYRFAYQEEVPMYALAHRATDEIYLDNDMVMDVDLITLAQGYQIYPGGQNYPLDVGVLSMGTGDFNQTFEAANGTSINGTFITSWLYNTGKTPSYSYGMHIGSVALDIPGSLYLGGFDSSRVLGNVSAQPYETGDFPINMLDIGVDVISGGSPFKSANISGLLASGNSSLEQGTTVIVNGADPYMYLPQSTCDAIAAELPVTFNPGLGLYIWNTTDPRFAKIVTSPSVLAFTFSENALNIANFTINVPFALLNLTLQAPFMDTPTSYFPCMPTNSTYVLGRAFLQAAFVGVNWGVTGSGNWFLAQAPGPGYEKTPSVTTIGATDTTISGSDNSWENSWSNFWTELPIAPPPKAPDSVSNNTSSASPSPSSTSTSTSKPNNSTISSGALAGIGVGCAFAGIALIAAVVFYFYRRYNKQNQEHLQGGDCEPFAQDMTTAKAPLQFSMGEFNHVGPGEATLHEMEQGPNRAVHELEDREFHETYELP